MGIVDELRQSHDRVMESIKDLTDEELTKDNTIGKWSARDVVLHIAMWDGEALKALAVWRTGHEYDWTYADGYLKINDCWHEITKKMSVAQVLRMYNLIRAALIDDISRISDEIWRNRGGVPKWLSGITIEHNQWHLEKLQAYRKSLGK